MDKVSPYPYMGSGYVIASNAPDQLKRHAWKMQRILGNRIQLCDGVDDQTEIQAAMQAMYDAGGGPVYLSTGLFDIRSSLLMLDDRTRALTVPLIGEHATILDGRNNAGYVLSAIGTDAPAVPLEKIYIANLFIRRCTNGILLRNCWNPYLENIEIGHNADPAIGIGLTLSSGTVTGMSGLKAYGIKCWNTTTGLLLTGTGGGVGYLSINSFIKCAFQGTVGVDIPGVAGVAITTELFDQCQIEACTTGARIGTVSNVNRIKFRDCFFDGNTVDIENGAGALTTIVKGGLCHPALCTVTNAFRIFDNEDTVNHGTSVGTGAQQTIAHNLPGTPTRVVLTEYNTGGALPYESAAADAVNIYVTAVLGNTYRWKASIE